MKRLVVLLLTLAAVGVLGVSAMAAEPEETWVEVDISDQLIQCGGYPGAEKGFRPYSTNWERAKETLVAGMLKWEENIDIGQYSIDRNQLSQLMTEIINENPQLFYVTGKCNYDYYTSDNCIGIISPEYNNQFTSDDATAYQKAVTAALSGVQKSWSDFEKALYLHDYLAVHAQYDIDLLYRRNVLHETTSGDPGYTAYGVLVEGVGVCQAYTLAYRELLNHVGIGNGTVQSNELNHIWNLVEIDEEWYHVDVTWDDPVSPGMQWKDEAQAVHYNAKAPDYVGKVWHTYFLLSTEAMRAEEDGHDANDWVISPAGITCTSEIYDEWYGNTVTSLFVPLGDSWYYILYIGWNSSQLINEGGFYKTEDPEEGGTNVYKVTERWYLWESNTSYLLNLYSGLCAWNGLLVYNTPTEIRSYDPDTGETALLYTPDTSEGYIYGLMMDGNKATYLLTTDLDTFETWELWWDVELVPYEAADEGDYSVCQVDGTLYVRQDAADGILVLALYDANGCMEGLAVTSKQNEELSADIPESGYLKIFALNANYAPKCAAQTVQTESA